MAGTEVVSWEERLKREAKEVVESYRPDVGAITFDQGIMKYEGVQVPDNRLDVVVLGAGFVNLFYKKPYVAGQPFELPDCYALSLSGRGMVPEDTSQDKQNGECLTCPNLKWGSDPKPGSRGKACKEKMKLAVIPAVALTSPESIAKAGIAILTLPVTSVSIWKLYAQKVVVSTGGSTWGVISRMREEPDPKTQYKIQWEAQSQITDKAILAALGARLDWARDLLIQPYREPETQPETPAPTGKTKKF